jgi:hypothetical protein
MEKRTRNSVLDGWPSAVLTMMIVLIVGLSSGRIPPGNLEEIAKVWYTYPVGPHWAYITLWTITMYVALLSAKRIYELGRSRLLVAITGVLAVYALVCAVASGVSAGPVLTPSSFLANIVLWVFLVITARPKKQPAQAPNWKKAGEPLFAEPKNPNKTFED